MSQIRSVKEQIGFLIELQVADKEIYALNKEKKGIPTRIKTIEETLGNKKAGIEQAKQNLKSLQVKLKDREVDLQQKEEQIKRLQVQLYQLKSNKEYSAMLREIEGVRADNSILEEEIIKLMDEIEIAKKKIAKEIELFKEEEADSRKEKDVIKAREKKIDLRLTELFAQRGKVVPNIEKQILARYERVLKNRDGLAIVPVEDGACSGCHMGLPSQVVSEAKLKEDVIVCGSCNRILYVDDNVEIN